MGNDFWEGPIKTGASSYLATPVTTIRSFF